MDPYFQHVVVKGLTHPEFLIIASTTVCCERCMSVNAECLPTHRHTDRETDRQTRGGILAVAAAELGASKTLWAGCSVKTRSHARLHSQSHDDCAFLLNSPRFDRTFPFGPGI